MKLDKLGVQPDITHDLAKAFEFAAQHGFYHIELLLDHPYYSLDVLNPEEVLELKEVSDVDVILHASAVNTNFIATSSVMRRASYDELLRTITFAEKVEAELITFHIGWNPGFITSKGFYFDQKLYDEHNYRVLKEEMIPFLKEHDSILAIENTIEISGGLRRAMKEILDETDVKLTFDIGHHSIKGGHDIFVSNFYRVVNVHLHDNDGRVDEHLPLGEGRVDLSIIPESFDGFLTLELRDEDAILKSKEYVEKWRG